MAKLKWFASIIIVGIILNIFLLYYFLFSLRIEVKEELDKINTQFFQPVTTSDLNTNEDISPNLSTESSSCSYSCLKEIDKLKERLANITPQVIKEVQKTSIFPNSSFNQSMQEYILYFGSGSSMARDWEDVPGVSLDIDKTKYKKMDSVIFEASLRIPTANGAVYARLFNKTDDHPVWFSEVSSEGAASAKKQSGNITLDPGKKTYQVQMKTSMGFESVLDSSRIKIIALQ